MHKRALAYLLISASAVIAKYLDNIKLSCYRGVIEHHITLATAATKIKTGSDLFLFLVRLSHFVNFYFFEKSMPNGHIFTDYHF